MKSSCLTWTSCRSIVYLAPVLASLATNPLNAQTEIALSSDRTSRSQIYTQQISPPAAPVEVTTGGGGSQLSSEPDWSPDGSKIAYDFGAPGVRGIHTINPNGTGDTQITPPGSGSYPCADDTQPAWSPDGRYIAYICNNSGVYAIWEHDNTQPPNNPNSESLVFGLSKGFLFNPTWSRDGKSLAFVSAIPGSGQPQIQLFTLASKVLKPLTNSAFNDFDPTFSPDGKTIAFSSTRNGVRQIFTMSMSCPETQAGCPAPTQLTKDPSDAQHCAWSSDGLWVAFVSNRITTLNPTGKWQIYLLNPSQPEGPSNPVVAVSDGSANDDFPAWPAAAGNGVDMSYSSCGDTPDWQGMYNAGIRFVAVESWGGVSLSPCAAAQLQGAQGNSPPLTTAAYALLNFRADAPTGTDQAAGAITNILPAIANVKFISIDVETIGGSVGESFNAWKANKNYTKDYEIADTSKSGTQHVQKVVVAGKSGGSPPSWNDSGGQTPDGTGTLVWQDTGVVVLDRANRMQSIRQAVQYVQNYQNNGKGMTPVIYTNRGDWSTITGNCDNGTKNNCSDLIGLKLWDTESGSTFKLNGQKECGDGIQGLSPFKAYSTKGWTARSGNQYDLGPSSKDPSKDCNGKNIFGVIVDLDYFDPTLFQ